MKTSFPAALGILLISIAASAQDMNKEIKVDVKSCKLDQTYTPDFGVPNVTQKRWKPKQWVEMETILDIKLAPALGGRDGTYAALTVKYYVGFNKQNKERKNIVLTGTVNYKNIVASEPNVALAYVTPATLKRVLEKDNAGKNDVTAFGLEVQAGGQTVAAHSSNGSFWWINADKQPNTEKFDFQDGEVLPKSKTPFSVLWADYDLLSDDK
jgi:hypothetical protein